ncbi:hypothetical protein Aab01nite_60190 [Paractinoplanes abujensis]|uniref:Uncharacterized protein n=1 Tax=Paractinoplanes abujensis TaxID=882441 RepID=A0A7W7CXD8_9ACTN|nr:hypothetical protein [Actinoplanes abujensis]MBB4696434.1 hypothetical protein [Actinoplanes abujensis]GID22429.1 hypothetical protein Aab01nite_60190 [Actinoplanes abujensis]
MPLLVVRAAAVVFAYGTVVHVFQLVTGGYPGLPGWLAAYFVSLTVLDALAVLLLLCRPVAGLYVGGFILVTDALANFYANYVVDTAPGVTAGRIGQAVITLLAVGLVALTPATVRALRRR